MHAKDSRASLRSMAMRRTMSRPGAPRTGAGRRPSEAAAAPSPAWSGADAGFFDRDRLVAELQGLIEAERACGRLAAGLVAQTGFPALRALAETVRRDEIRWRRMLGGALRALGATPTDGAREADEEATAAARVDARLMLLNRRQTGLVRRLEALLPKVRSDQLHGDLLRILAAHHRNIGEAETALARMARARGAPDLVGGA